MTRRKRRNPSIDGTKTRYTSSVPALRARNKFVVLPGQRKQKYQNLLISNCGIVAQPKQATASKARSKKKSKIESESDSEDSDTRLSPKEKERRKRNLE